MKKFIFKLIKKSFLKFCQKFEKKVFTNYLGTPYGGWYFIAPKQRKNINLISAGVGEDISFDIEFFNNFESKIIFVDPTPRAVQHIQEVIKNLGSKKVLDYDLSSGEQPVNSYDLTQIKEDNFLLIDKALYNKSGLKIKFFKPSNDEYVSHSISNFQNRFDRNSDFIEVHTITLENIINTYNLDKVDIFKLDIEGAENQVLPDMLKKNIFPHQILVEFDELSTNFIKPYLKAFYIFLLLFFNNYELVKTDNFPNYLFVYKRSELFKN